MNDDELMKLMAQVDPQTKRIPPGIREIVDAVEAAERERRRQQWQAMLRQNQVTRQGIRA